MLPSSTFSSDPLPAGSLLSSSLKKVRRVFGGLRVAVWALLTILLLDASFSTFDSFWERFRPSRLEKQASYRDLLAGRLSVDTVIIGSSTVNMGLDPEIFDAYAGTHSFNAGQLGYAPANIAVQVMQEVVESSAVSRVIYAVDSWTLISDIRDRSTVDAHGRGKNFLYDWALYRNRDIFFFWLNELIHGDLTDPRTAWQRHMQAGGRFSRLNRVVSHADGYMEIDGALNADWPDYIRPRSDPDPEQLEDFRALLRLACEAHLDILILRMPEFVRTYNENAGAHAATSRIIAEEAAAFGIPVLDFTVPGSFPQDDASLYFDIHHLNRNGAALLSKLAGEATAKLIGTLGRNDRCRPAGPVASG